MKIKYKFLNAKSNNLVREEVGSLSKLYICSFNYSIGITVWTELWCNEEYRCAPVAAGNTFQDLPQLHETADNTECYIRVTYIDTVKFNWKIRAFWIQKLWQRGN
jgi:hypothetical protein